MIQVSTLVIGRWRMTNQEIFAGYAEYSGGIP